MIPMNCRNEYAFPLDGRMSKYFTKQKIIMANKHQYHPKLRKRNVGINTTVARTIYKPFTFTPCLTAGAIAIPKIKLTVLPKAH